MAIPSFCTLKSRTVLSISGPEAKEFLQGLVTNNLDHISEAKSLYAALLTPQGKILFDFFISHPEPDTFWLECSADQSADLAKRLKFYKLRADVTITPLTDSLKVIAIWGNSTADVFAGTTAGSAGKILDGFGYVDPRDAQAGLRVIIDNDKTPEGLAPSDAQAYNAHRIKLGLADTDADIGSSERFPHECNLDVTNGVDFSKGCYVGQEVVSRMYHKTTVRKRILPVSATQPLVTGDKINAGEKSIGDILSTAGPHALAAVRLDRADQALAANVSLTAGDADITLTRSSWATFDFPGENNDTE